MKRRTNIRTNEKKTRNGAVFFNNRSGDRVYDVSNSTNILRDMNRAILEETKGTGSNPGAVEWFTEKIKSGQMILPDNDEIAEAVFRNRSRQVSRTFFEMPGQMFAFVYRPKTAAKLPYYDMTPLIITLPRESDTDNILGINLHYLDPELRGKLLDILLLRSTAEPKREVPPPKGVGEFMVDYQMLKSMKYLLSLPCVRSYDPMRIIGRPVLIPSNEWGNATALPFESFAKAMDDTIWLESRRKLLEFVRMLYGG